MELLALIPMFYHEESKYLGLECTVEENIVIYKANKDDVGMFIVCGSGVISESVLEKDLMTDGKILSKYILTEK